MIVTILYRIKCFTEIVWLFIKDYCILPLVVWNLKKRDSAPEYTDDSCSNRKDIFAGHDPYSSPSSSEHDDEDKEIELDFSVFAELT